MSDFLPKEKQTAFQRWEMASFDVEGEPSTSSSIKQQSANDKEQIAAAREQGAP